MNLSIVQADLNNAWTSITHHDTPKSESWKRHCDLLRDSPTL